MASGTALERQNARLTQQFMADECLQHATHREGHASRKRIRDDIVMSLTLNHVFAACATDARSKMHDIADECTSDVRKYTAGVLSSGGCLDTIGCIAAGMRPIWGTEICERKRALWRRLTGADDLGDTFRVDWTKVQRPNVIWSGQPCMDYSLAGSKTGVGGDTGWMFTSQTDVLLNVQPDTFVLEMVANALNIDGGAAVDKIVDIMSEKYDVQRKVLRVADFGDESNRERLFIVGVHNRLQAPKGVFEFPEPMLGHSRTARHIAIPDQDVPRRYWKRISHWFHNRQ